MTTSSCKRILGVALLAAAMAAPLSLPAAAQPWRGHGRYDRHDYRRDDHRGPGAGAIVGGALLGLGLGAVIGSQLAAPPPVVYAPPPPQYYAPPPPPVYYGN